MGEKKQYRRHRPRAKWRKPTVPRPQKLGANWAHVSTLPGYLPERVHVTFDFLKDHDVPAEFIDALEQEFSVKIRMPADCGIDGRDDSRLAHEARKRRLIVLTRNHTDFFSGHLIPIETCPGIFAIDGSSNILPIVENMGALLRELGPHLPWDWWRKTKVKFGPVECNLRRHEHGHVVRRRMKIDKSGRVWFSVTS